MTWLIVYVRQNLRCGVVSANQAVHDVMLSGQTFRPLHEDSCRTL